MSVNFPVSQNFDSTNFQDLANNIAVGSGNVVNTDYRVITKPTWGDYIINFFLSMFNSSKNLDYNVDRIYNKISSDIQKSLSNYIMEMAENPGVDSEVIQKELLKTQAALEVLNNIGEDELEISLTTGIIVLKSDKFEVFKLEREPEVPEFEVSKEELNEAIKEAFDSHRKKFSERKDLNLDQKLFMNLKEGEYVIQNFSRVQKDDKWMLEVSFIAPKLGSFPRVATCSLEEFPYDLLNLPGDPIIKPFKKDEMIATLQAKENACIEQLKQAPINHKEKFIQRTQELCDKVEPLILAIIERQSAVNPQKSLDKLRMQWNLFAESLKFKNRFEVNAKALCENYYQKMDLSTSWNNPIGPTLDAWSEKNVKFTGDLSSKKVIYLEPIGTK